VETESVRSTLRPTPQRPRSRKGSPEILNGSSIDDASCTSGGRIPVEKVAKKALPLAPAAPVDPVASGKSFQIVGLGASAGGLEAYEQFFHQVPPDCGLAFVLVPHLDPSHASILTEILQRSTPLPVVQAEDQMAVVPDHVYVIPPNRDMAIFHGTLQLSVPQEPRGQRMPIDAFLRSLAEDQGERAVGVILSGTGTDGTQGLRAILGAGGVALVQDPATAKYDGMPSSAIRAGFVTRVLPADKMPAALLADAPRLSDRREPPSTAAPRSDSGINRLLMLLRSATGRDFSLYKKSTIRRRIERRMAQHNLTDLELYGRYLKEHPSEVQALFKELLINVTSFFRDPEAFATLKQDILPQLLGNKPADYVFRAWVPGCSTGEEAYSISMLLREYMDENQREFRIQLYSTDLDEEAIAVARGGVYPPNIGADVTPERLRRFFTKQDAGYRIKKDIREMVVFAVQDAIKDPPFTRLDLVSCRNLMIYLEPELQDRLLLALHFALKPGGVLLLSPSESTGNHPELFAPLSRKWKLYRAVHSAAPTRAPTLGRPPWTAGASAQEQTGTAKKAPQVDFAELTRRALLDSYAPASVLADAKGDILYVHGDTGKYLRPAPGQASLNVVTMARDGLQVDLRAALHAAAGQREGAVERNASVKLNGLAQAVRIGVRRLGDPEAGQGLVLVSFQDLATAPSAKPARSGRTTGSPGARRVDELERELAYTRENLQATIEEQQASNEELKSTNEELQSTNEELQSTNEELETSKEELQSVNEELNTVNAELQAKIEQLGQMQNDMKNLLDNLSIGTIFLDQNLAIRRFTREAARVYRLVASDVGRPLADIKSVLAGDDPLVDEARRVLDCLAPCEREVRTAGGASYLARIQPYRTLENVIDGVVLTFTDISRRVEAEAAVTAARTLAEGIVDTVRESLVVLDADLKVVTASRSFYQWFRTTSGETVGRRIYELGNGQWDIPALRELLETILPRDQSFAGFAVEHDFPAIGRRKMLLNARHFVSGSTAQLILLAMEDAGDA
jgi:two-component system, chemotaxis family, CheB/CheR fusion protein